jgi:hypothetical protein
LQNEVDKNGLEDINELIDSDYKNIVDSSLVDVLDQFKSVTEHFRGKDLDCRVSCLTKRESLEEIHKIFSEKKSKSFKLKSQK